MSLPVALGAAVCTQILSQLFKVVFYSIRKRSFDIRYLSSAGGMPSAHSAFVSALSTSVAFTEGPASNAFAISAVFAFIVIYDAYRVRGTVEKLIHIVNQLRNDRRPLGLPDGDTDPIELPKKLGHSIPEIAVGVLVGVLLGGGITLLFRGFY